MAIWLSVLGGLLLLLVGGDLLVRGAVATAKALGVSPLMIGLTLVGFGTSTPEMLTSVTAALNGFPGLAVGNVVGSNLANILLVLGLSALIFPMALNAKGFERDAAMLLLSSLACVSVVLYGQIGPLVGGAFIAILLAYIALVYRQETQTPHRAAAVAEHRAGGALKRPVNMFLSVAIAVLGIAITIVGARFLVAGSIELAQRIGVSETTIGLTIVAVGTSMPELVTALTAAVRKQADVSYGSIVGSNIFNVLFVLGSTSVVKTIDIPPQVAGFDIWVMLAATLLLVLFARTGIKLQRWEGAVLVASYVAYSSYLIFIASSTAA